MKRIILILAALLLSISAFAQHGKNIYQKYSDAEGVTAVYISPAMFRLIGSIPDLEVGEDKVNISPLIQALNGFYVIDSENPDINGKLRTEVERFISNGKYEMLMLEYSPDFDRTIHPEARVEIFESFGVHAKIL